MNPLLHQHLSISLDVTVEIVTGDVIDIIYQIRPLEYFGDPYWVQNYRQKADDYAKMVVDTIIRNTKIGDKLITHYQKSEKLPMESALKKLEELTPLAKNPKLRTTATQALESSTPKPGITQHQPPQQISSEVASVPASAPQAIASSWRGHNDFTYWIWH